MTNVRTLTKNEARTMNGGKTYYCPFNYDYSGGYWATYWHVLNKKCFLKDPYLRALWNAGWNLIDIGKFLGGFGL